MFMPDTCDASMQTKAQRGSKGGKNRTRETPAQAPPLWVSQRLPCLLSATRRWEAQATLSTAVPH